MFKLPYTFGISLIIVTILLPINGNSVRDATVRENQLSLSNILQYNSILYPLTTVSRAELVGEQCHKRMLELGAGILERAFWALKVLDASGTKPPAFMLGNNFWLGSNELCKAARAGLSLDISRHVAHKMNMSLLTERAPFDVDYRITYATHNSPHQADAVYGQVPHILHLGLCVPAECSSKELMHLLNAYFKSEIFLSGNLHALEPRVLHVKKLAFKAADFYKMLSFKLIVGFVTYTLFMTVCAHYLRRKRLQSTKAQMKSTSLEAFILCYDLQTNCSKILAPPEAASNTFAFLNGGRVVSALIATFFHTFILLNAIVSNPTQLFTYVSNIGNMDVAMDVFLLISGFLQTYIFLRNRRQLEILKRLNFIRSIWEILKMIFHRYLRLAPLYYFMICVSYVTLQYLDNTTVFHSSGFLAEKCEHHWWHNVLFIHNLYDYKEMCLIWTWYLSCEMQYAFTLIVFLIIYTKHPKCAKISVLLLLIASLAYQAIVGLQLNYQISLETTFTHFTQLYTNPLVRCFPYLSGALTSWLYLEYNAQLRTSKILTNLYSNLVYLVFMICTKPAPLGRGYSVGVETFIFVLQRACYTLSGCWCVLAMANNHISWCGHFFSAKIFQKAIHVSYALSLLNPLLIIGIFKAGSHLVFVEPIKMFVLYVGLIIILYIISFPVTVFFEMPYRNISSLLIKRAETKRAKSS